MFSRFLPCCCVALAGLAMSSAGAQNIARVQLTDNDLSCSQIYAESQQMDTVMQLAGPGQPAANAAVSAIPAPARAANTHAAANQAAFNQAQMQQLMAGSDRADLRAAASDPAKVAQVTAMMQNPQLAVAAQRAAAAGVNPSLIQSQLAAAGAMQQAAAASGGGAVAAPAPVSSGLGGLFGALASRNAGVSGVANASQAAGLFGAFTGNTPAAAPVQQVAPAAQPVAAAASMGAQAQARKSHLTQMFLSKGCKVSDIPK